jgi:glycosyltransferase involved in cell wall biosynthesis
MTGKSESGRTLLYLYRGDEQAGDGFKAMLEQRGWQVTKAPVSYSAPLWGLKDVFRRPDLAEYDVVAAAEYYLTWAICLRLLFRRGRPKVAALGFNQSKRLVLTGIRPVDWLLNGIWRRASLFLVHSRDEAALFAKIHEIPKDRFVFSQWGFDLPAHDFAKTKLPPEPYVAMVGQNNRDLETFCRAVERARVKGVLITASYMLERNPVQSPNVLILTDRPMEECLNYVAGSFAHLILVVDADRGAGHISAVSAMLLGKPQIFSDVAPLSDYLTNGFNGIAVPVGDAEAVAAAIRRLHEDQALSSALSENGRRFALEALSYEASADRTANALLRLATS